MRSMLLRFRPSQFDVEGNEIAVLQGIDFQKYTPKWILVETRGRDIGNYLANRCYEEISRLSDYDGYADVLYRHRIA